MNTPGITVQVVCALPSRQAVRSLGIPLGSTASDAMHASGLLRDFPEIEPNLLRLGIFGTLVRPDAKLRDGDRVEIYRPLVTDPQEARRRRAAQTKGGR